MTARSSVHNVAGCGYSIESIRPSAIASATRVPNSSLATELAQIGADRQATIAQLRHRTPGADERAARASDVAPR